MGGGACWWMDLWHTSAKQNVLTFQKKMTTSRVIQLISQNTPS